MLFSKIQKLGRGKSYISMLIIVKPDFNGDNCLMGKKHFAWTNSGSDSNYYLNTAQTTRIHCSLWRKLNRGLQFIYLYESASQIFDVMTLKDMDCHFLNTTVPYFKYAAKETLFWSLLSQTFKVSELCLFLSAQIWWVENKFAKTD